MNITIRREEKIDHRAVEELTREAFWNLHVPGCNEHLLAHKLRSCAAFIPALDFVAEKDGQVVGSIMYCRSTVKNDDQKIFDVITFGPLSVLPAFQKRGIGGMLIRHSLKAAAGLGHQAVLIYGDPAYYRRFGFQSAQAFGISTSEGKFIDPLMALEIVPGALDHVSGRFLEGEAYSVDPDELIKFDKTFPFKEKRVTESQKRFAEMAGQ